MTRATSRAVCAHFAEAMRTHGVPAEILTDNGKVFTGRFVHKDIEVLFDRICRENGIDHLLTAPRRPTTTGKIERFHRTLRQEFLTGRVFADLSIFRRSLRLSLLEPRRRRVGRWRAKVSRASLHSPKLMSFPSGTGRPLDEPDRAALWDE
jgi:transposase InsO family protein